ncbi:MAG: hypothetical protein PHS58_06820 [Bacteroidales bacterium]|nr:hypothetical protein [Bacteroidales bacterium]MDD3208910.1 hypothetical protein [Bacteroidales bacterium]MDD3697718.1 hypothetical protein [Bacteroidales bacterium]MDD4473597.1 hypothetical protein [Bacteroidales bacterium]MDD5047042.1 hypothetical protein [Bacteroidales bacterium]
MSDFFMMYYVFVQLKNCLQNCLAEAMAGAETVFGATEPGRAEAVLPYLAEAGAWCLPDHL